VQKRLNRSKCHFGANSCESKEPRIIRKGSRSPTGRDNFVGDMSMRRDRATIRRCGLLLHYSGHLFGSVQQIKLLATTIAC